MKDPPGLLTVSNPRYTGFKVLERGSNHEGVEYADAEAYLSYTANPYYAIERSRYYLSLWKNGYIIDNIEPLESI
ncbi:MAG: hypothetical protein GX754_12490 [Clostridiaceae bacterium]|nr:hypothetical protein [Clostridiaceae bacterium]